MGQAIKKLLNRAISQAMRGGQIVWSDERDGASVSDRIVRVPSAPAVRLREAGPRKFVDVPPSELAALMDGLVAATPRLGAGSADALYRAALSVYGGQRLTEQARKVLEHARGLGED